MSTYFDPKSDVCKDLTQLPNAFLSVPQWSKPYFLNMVNFLQVREPTSWLPGLLPQAPPGETSRQLLPGCPTACLQCRPFSHVVCSSATATACRLS